MAEAKVHPEPRRVKRFVSQDASLGVGGLAHLEPHYMSGSSSLQDLKRFTSEDEPLHYILGRICARVRDVKEVQGYTVYSFTVAQLRTWDLRDHRGTI